MNKILPMLGFLAFFVFILSAALFGGGGTAGAVPINPVATEEKAEEYATASAKMGAPWEIVLLTDAIQAQAMGAPDIEDVNPVYTALEFLFLDVTVEHLEVVDSSYDEETESWDYTYGWVYSHAKRYTAKTEILGFIGITDHELFDLTPETLIDHAQDAAARWGDSTTKYSVDFSANSDFETVLRDYIRIPATELQQVLELYHADYLSSWLSPEALARIDEIKATYGMYQFVDDLGEYQSYEGLTFVDGNTEVVYFNQLDTRWKNSAYGTDHIGGYGCGPTAMAIVISTLTGSSYDPVYMATWAYQNGYWAKGNGSYHSLIPGAAAGFGLSVSGCTAAEPQRILDALSNGSPVVALMAKGHFTSSGHYIVLRGVTADGRILVADPASFSRSQQSWPLSTILNEARKGAGAGGPFWIIG